MRKIIDSQNRHQLRSEREALMARIRSLPSGTLRRSYMQARLQHMNNRLDEERLMKSALKKVHFKATSLDDLTANMHKKLSWADIDAELASKKKSSFLTGVH